MTTFRPISKIKQKKSNKTPKKQFFHVFFLRILQNSKILYKYSKKVEIAAVDAPEKVGRKRHEVTFIIVICNDHVIILRKT